MTRKFSCPYITSLYRYLHEEKNGAIVSPAVWRHNQRYRGKQFFPDLLCFRIPAFHICPRKSYAKVSVAVLSHNQRYSGRQFFPDLLCFRNRASFHICSRKKLCQSVSCSTEAQSEAQWPKIRRGGSFCAGNYYIGWVARIMG